MIIRVSWPGAVVLFFMEQNGHLVELFEKVVEIIQNVVEISGNLVEII